MRWTRIVSPDERHSFADGEAVWSWRPKAGAKFARRWSLRATVTTKPGLTGENTE